MHKHRIVGAIFGAALLIAASAVQGQPYGAPITLEQAKRVLAAAEAESKKININSSVAILDAGGHMVLFQRMDNSQFAGVEVAREKAWSAAGFRRPGKAFEDRLAKGGADFRILHLHGARAVDGGDPIVIDGRIVGAIGVSGGSGEQDGQVAKAGAAAVK